MKPLLLLGCLLVAFFTTLPAEAQQRTKAYRIEQIPDPTKTDGGYVSDPNGYLQPAEKSALNAAIRNWEGRSTAQFAVVIVGSIGEASPKDFASALFNYWKIGQDQKDNGLLILTVMDQRRTEFETGSGLEGVLPDAICYRVGMQKMVPFFQQKKYGAGLLAAVEEFQRVLDNPASLEEIKASKKGPQGKGIRFTEVLVVYAILNFLAHLLALFYIAAQLRSKQSAFDKYWALRRARNVLFLVLFPLPYALVWWWVSRKMHELRYQPRYSQKDGALMTIVPEAEEDAYLQRGQITEEEIGTAEYDVWVTADASDIKILRYGKPSVIYSNCPQCKYKTYYLRESKTLRHASILNTGLQQLTYGCKNCDYLQQDTRVLPQITVNVGGGGSSGSSSSSRGSSWGGGSSSGGGAGVSW